MKQPPVSKRVLVVGSDRWLFRKVEALLTRSSLEVYRLPKGRVALYVAKAVSFDLVLLLHPVDDIPSDRFVSLLRASLAPSRHPQFLVLTEQTRLEDFDCLADESLRVVGVGQDQHELEALVSQILNLSPRVGIRMIVRLDAEVSSGATSRMVQTENLSESGILVNSKTLLPVGTRSQVTFSLPDGLHDGPLVADAEVVRHTTETENLCGMGLRFLSFEGRGREVLVRYLAKLVADSRQGGGRRFIEPGAIQAACSGAEANPPSQAGAPELSEPS